MIARIWHGIVSVEKADEYSRYLRETGLKDYKTTPGNKGAFLLKNSEDGYTHFIKLSFWSDMAAIKKFAGPEVEKARYYQLDSKFLTELEPYVTHYEIVEPQEDNTNPTENEFSIQDIFFERPILFYR